MPAGEKDFEGRLEGQSVVIVFKDMWLRVWNGGQRVLIPRVPKGHWECDNFVKMVISLS